VLRAEQESTVYLYESPLVSLPPEIAQLPNLQMLYLRGNPLHLSLAVCSDLEDVLVSPEACPLE
jgi:hypothetical protein